MSVDPEVIRSESYYEIGALLQQQASELLQRWSRRAVEEQPNAKRVHHSVMLDHLYELLRTLGTSLAESEDELTCKHRLSALIHGEQRWEAGWSLPELIRDFQILRLVILDFLEESLERPIDYREVLAIGLALDEAIAASVAMYVKGRDEHLRQIEERRAEEAKQAHQSLQEHAEALQKADRRKNEFLAVLSHELRNPLAPMRNAVDILKLKIPPESELQFAQDVIDRQIQQMSRIIDDLLDVSRITLGKLRLNKEPVDAATVVATAAMLMQPFVESRNHQLILDIAPEPIWLDADAARLTQVVGNLLTNAAKYTNEGGQICLTVARQGDQALIKVRDDGVGISAELLPLIFEPYIQGEHLLDQGQGGLGIGLALVRSLVEMHGGTVVVTSPGRGQGSEFVVNLPVRKEAPPTIRKETKREGQGPVVSHRILVVDDNVDSAVTLTRLLRHAGHEVQAAHSGLAALELARTVKPDVVLLDIGLPGMDGLEVARRLRCDLGLTESLLVAVTGYGHDDDRRRSEDAGFNAHLVKPVDLGALNALLAQSRARPQG
jgi:signal transduction histidine kinase